MLKIAIITGSTRPGRKSEAVARWVYGIAAKRSDASFEVVDIAAFDLPLLDEAVPPMMNQYGQPHTKAWAAKIAAFDAFVFVTPEYNHSTSGALKNAIDFLYREWNDKAAGFVGYGGAGAPGYASAAHQGRRTKTEGIGMNSATAFKPVTEARPRRVTHRTRGRSHGAITRLVSPSDVGELIKPFVFLDYFDIDPKHVPPIGFHPHSGIATLTLLHEGRIFYEETSGTKGIIEPGGVEWMRAAGGVWHTGGVAGTARARGYQLWIALPADMEGIECEAQYLGSEHFRFEGPARVILGRYGGGASRVSAPTTINYLDVALKKAEKWRYQPPDDHSVAWVAVHEGRVATPKIVDKGELAVFEESNTALEFEGLDDTGFILGSAVKHPYDLVLGNYSVHTSKSALERGEAKITEIGKRLKVDGRL